jgi:hypothetical protein
MVMASCTIIRTSLPTEGHDNDNLLQDVIRLLSASDPVGRVGDYVAVHNTVVGNEGFVPLQGANPTKGTSGVAEICPSLIFTTYAERGVSEAQVEEFVDKLANIHPWEMPVIEVIRDGRSSMWEPQEKVA